MRALWALVFLTACTPPEVDEPGPCGGQGVQDEATGACVPEACGTSRWGLVERTGQTVHVEPGGSGDGSAEAPMGDVQAALDLAGERGSEAVLAAGSHAGTLLIRAEHGDAVLEGRCRELVTIDASGAPDGVRGLEVQGGGLTLAGFTLQGSHQGLFVGDPDHVGVELTVRGVELRDSRVIGLNVRDPDTSVVLEDVWLHDTQPDGEGHFGHGVNVILGARLEADGFLLERNHELGLFVVGSGSEAVLRDTTLRDTGQLPGRIPRGLVVSDGASLVAENLTVEGQPGIGLQTGGSGATVVVDGGVIRDSVPTLAGEDGNGVAIFSGASFVGTNLTIEGNRSAGFYVDGAGVGELRDSVVRGTLPRLDGTAGQGLRAFAGGTLIAERVAVEGNTGQGVRVGGAGSSGLLIDVQVRDTVAGVGTDGRGVAVGEGGSLDATRLLVERNGGIGLLVIGEDSTAVLDDVQLIDQLSVAGGTGGGGLAVQGGAWVQATGLEIARNRDHGVLVSGAAFLDLSDSVVRETQRVIGGTFGRGVIAQGGSTVLARDVDILDNHDVGLASLGSGSYVEFVGGAIRNTGTALDVRSGIGAAADLEGELRLDSVEVSDNTGPGIYSLEGGVVGLVDCTLTGNGLAGAVVLDGALEVVGGSVSGSVSHPSEGGGVGVLAWDLAGPPRVDIEGVEFADLVGPALYLRGPGSYRMSGSSVARSGGWPSLPGGVLATGGVQAWGGGQGLLLEGNRFEDLGADAILLDTAAATLGLDGDGAGQSFEGLAGEPLFVQRCDGPSTAEVLDGSGADPGCQDGARPLGPLLEFRLQVGEIEAVE